MEGSAANCSYSHGQGMTLEPLASFLQPEWNSLNRLPMHLWLQSDTDTHYRERMKTLGNVVVPAQGLLGMNLLQRLYAKTLKP